MNDFKKEFIQFVIQEQILLFGQFTLKSGRHSPYFFNSGLFNTGGKLATLGRYYALAIQESGVEFDMLFGPAYKGIPLVSTVSIALADHHQRDLPYAFNRKEAKTHGEGGNIVGAKLNGRVLIVDDVISAGLTIGESIDIVTSQGAEPVGVAISCDRQERGQNSNLSAVQEVSQRYELQVVSLIGLADIIRYLEEQNSEHLSAIKAYQSEYGVT